MFSILDAFSNSSNKISISSKSAQDLILIHQNLKPLNKSIFISQLSLIATAIADFATHQLSAVAHLSKAGLNFINILRAVFMPVVLRQSYFLKIIVTSIFS
jgi:hypothetical protein